MAKAKLTLASGTEVQIEGTPAEVGALLERFEAPVAETATASERRSKKRTNARRAVAARIGPQGHIQVLKDSGFFDERRTINDVQQELERNGHIYPLTHLSTPLLRLVRRKVLRRLKQGDMWVYVDA